MCKTLQGGTPNSSSLTWRYGDFAVHVSEHQRRTAPEKELLWVKFSRASYQCLLQCLCRDAISDLRWRKILCPTGLDHWQHKKSFCFEGATAFGLPSCQQFDFSVLTHLVSFSQLHSPFQTPWLFQSKFLSPLEHPEHFTGVREHLSQEKVISDSITAILLACSPVVPAGEFEG